MWGRTRSNRRTLEGRDPRQTRTSWKENTPTNPVPHSTHNLGVFTRCSKQHVTRDGRPAHPPPLSPGSPCTANSRVPQYPPAVGMATGTAFRWTMIQAVSGTSLTSSHQKLLRRRTAVARLAQWPMHEQRPAYVQCCGLAAANAAKMWA